MMRPFGGFPSSLLVREEMKVVWSIVLDGIAKQQTKWVIVGSPGVGKSVLTVLLCFHLAQAHGASVFLARKLKGEFEGPQMDSVAICIHPGGRAVGYPKDPDEKIELKTISAAFGKQYKRPSLKVTVLDGWSQSELATSTVGEEFGGFDLLATSVQYLPKDQDTRHLVLLPAWKDENLELLWRQLGREPFAFYEHRYYSSGSVRDLFRDVPATRSRTRATVTSASEEMCRGLLASYGGSRGSGIDSLRRCYLDNEKPESYIDCSYWNYVVDSAFALKCLSAKAPLAVYERSLKIAESCGPSHYGWMFEALVHQLFHVPNMVVTFHLRPDLQFGATANEYESISLGKNAFIECGGVTYSDAKLYLGNRIIDMTRSTYWHPDYPEFPVIDAIACLPDKKTIFYVQLTVGKQHDVDCEQLTVIHDIVKQSLQLTDTEGWTFKYVAIGPYEVNVNRLTLSLKNKNNQWTASKVGEVAIWKGYMTYSIE